MGRQRFVTPATVRLELSDGDWVEIKDALSYGEQQRLNAEMMASSVTDGQMAMVLRWDSYNLERLRIWLVDWSLEDATGKRVPISRDSIAALDNDTAEEIGAALEAHIKAQEATKNPPTAAPKPKPKPSAKTG